MKKLISLMLAMLLLVGVLAGCGEKTAEPVETPVVETPVAETEKEETADVEETPVEETPETRVVIDALGREVEVPYEVDAIIALGNAPRMITFLGLADRVVGAAGMDFETITPVTAYAYATKDLWCDLPLVGSDGMGNTTYYTEDIIMCQPDVILCTYTEDIVNDLEAKTGIPVVAVGMGTLFEDDYDDALRILGEACGVSERAEEVIAYIDACLEDLNVRTCDIPDEEKPTVLSAAATFKGAHGIEGVRLVDSVLTAINANNIAAASAEGTTAQTAEVDREQILAWNPDYIFCDCSGVPLVKQDMAEDPNFYAQLTAYNEGRIYQHPSTTSYYSNLEIPLVNCYFIGSVLYPEAFADVDLEAKAAEIFAFFLDDADFMNKLNESGAGYGLVTAE